ncbi:helix-turn-helix domain-containing protein [Rhodanobacter sp. 7MK24]|uniref:helix-turn-helix domain-containing protein n=1 Tax=Rhodanobacter sp. 7MK24 TaxID=2775922 RepID=UPI00177ECFA3|nr:helix-turn-helix domain-containing protein [Rhodanobacter sp. 7MK24]MBD8882307.1 helix-turn-helix domain-containing protein [Rhodanobacter sp. 7MK24]
MKLRLTEELVEHIRATPKPDEKAFVAEEWPAIDDRIKALDDLLSGATISAVATRHSIDRKTISRLLRNAVERGVDGRYIGYQACIPFKRFAPPTPQSAEVPANAHAFALEMLLRALPVVAEMLHAFKKALPTRSCKSPAFNRLYHSIAAILRQRGYDHHYPLNTTDGGRRAIQDYLKRYRARLESEAGAEQPETGSITRVDHIFTLRPFDRFEYDEHRIDLDAWFALPLSDGTFRLELVKCIWLLAIFDVASASSVATSLVVGRKYDSDDVCDLIARSLKVWEPRELVVPSMRYSERAWMPSHLAVDGVAPRGLLLAMDNDSSHISNMTRENVTDFRLGITHYGRAGIAETRACVESRFKLFEDEISRYIAGGYRPETHQNERIVVSTLPGDRYPILVNVLEDLYDTYFTAANVSDRSTRDTRTPKMLIDEYVGSGALLWQSPNTQEQVRRLTVRRMRVTIRGSKRNKVPPVVYQDYARYRSPQLMGQWSLIGRTFNATYENPSDIRELTLWDDEGKRLFTLHALAPYASAPHTFKIRQRAAAWNRANGARPHRPSEAAEVVQDNVLAYHEAVRAAAATTPWATGLIAGGAIPGRLEASRTVPTQAPLAGLRPLSGKFSLR